MSTKALVIIGGSDKGQWAKRLASDFGRYAEISAETLFNRVDLFKVLEAKPKTLIVSGMEWNDLTMSRVKSMLSQDTWDLVHGHRRCMVEAVRLIFLHDGSFLSDRRFSVMRATDQGLVPA